MGTSLAWVRAGGKHHLSIGPLRFWYYFIMANGSTEKVRKRQGRPATGRDPVMTLRFPPTLRSEIEGWANQQEDKPKRSEAIRRLIEFALAVKTKRHVKARLVGGRTKRNRLKQNHDNVTVFFPVQCRMARGALGMGVRDLAAAAKVSVDTVLRFERGDELKGRTIEALRRALESAGVEFTNGDQPGVRLTRAAAAQPAEPASGSNKTVATKAARRKTAKATEKKR
jgi:ribosome-binding protein aMBF1 (putative translation factor)